MIQKRKSENAGFSTDSNQRDATRNTDLNSNDYEVCGQTADANRREGVVLRHRNMSLHVIIDADEWQAMQNSSTRKPCADVIDADELQVKQNTVRARACADIIEAE